MKKFLLSVVFTWAVLFSSAQLVLNEVYSNPNSTNNSPKHEFFELYNPTSQTLNTDCYTLIAYYKTTKDNSNRGFIVLNLPSREVRPFGYLTGASTSPFNVQSLTNNIAGFVWANLGTGAGQDPTGYIRNYQVTTSGTTLTGYNPDAGISNLNDIFRNIQSAELAVFLFNGSTYVGGVKAGFGSDNTVPAEIREMPDINNIPVTTAAGVTCNATSFSVRWSSLPGMEFSEGAQGGGSDNGFARKSDGLCGNWVKTANGHTPNASNLQGGTTITPPSLTTTQKIICGERIDFSITSSTNNSFFPIEVQLYEDGGTIGALGAGDTYVRSYTPNINSASNTVYSFLGLDPTKTYLLVYRSHLGCIDRIASPVPVVGSVSTTERFACGTTVFFRIDGLQGNLTPEYAFPITARLYKDVGTTVGKVDNGDELLQTFPQPITTSGTTWYAFEDVTSPTGPYLVSYETKYNCFSKAVTPPPSTGELTPTQKNYCNSRIDFSINGTGDLPLLPSVEATVYYDNNGNGKYDAGVDGLAPNQPIVVSTLPSATYTVNIPEADRGKKIMISYKTYIACYDLNVTPDEATGTLTTAQGFVCGSATVPSEVMYSVQGATEDAGTGAFPMTVLLYYDRNGNEIVDAEDGAPMQQATVNEFMTSAASFKLPLADRSQDVVLVYKTALGCFDKSVSILTECAALPVKMSSFTASRNRQSKQQVDLAWTTAQEQINKGFHIQRKAGASWQTIGFVPSKAQNGTTSEAQHYSFKDQNAFTGASQYRLLQEDLDGKTAYSKEVAVSGLGQSASVLVYPNPGRNGTINLLFEKSETIRDVFISDLAGRVVKSYTAISGGSLTVDHLSTGFYTIRIRDRQTGVEIVEKIIMQ